MFISGLGYDVIKGHEFVDCYEHLQYCAAVLLWVLRPYLLSCSVELAVQSNVEMRSAELVKRELWYRVMKN